MHASTKIFAGIVTVLQLGCAGNVRTTVLKADSLTTPGATFDGVVYYAPQLYKLTYEFTARVDDSGRLVGGCKSVTEKQEVALMPDLTRPMLLSNSSDAFSAAKFGVALDKGMLASINVEPTQKLSDVLTPLIALIPGAAAKSSSLADACNAAPKLSEVKKLP